MMMGLGSFVFSLATLAYQESHHQMDWRYESQPGIGEPPTIQFLGPGEELLTLKGVLLPAFKGLLTALEVLRQMASSGQAHSLVSGTGRFIGNFVITRLSQEATLFYVNGTARRSDFTLELKRVQR